MSKRSVIGNVLAGDIHKTCGTHQNTTVGGGHLDTVGSFTGDRWTQLTLLVNIMTQTTFLHSNLSVSFCCCESIIFRQEQTCDRIFRYIGEREAKSQFIAQDCLREKLATKVPTWTITQYFHQNIKLEATPGVKTLCQRDSARLNKTTPRTSSSEQLEVARASSSRRLGAAEDPSIEKKVHLHPNTDGETQQEVRPKAAKRGGARIDNQVLQGVSPLALMLTQAPIWGNGRWAEEFFTHLFRWIGALRGLPRCVLFQLFLGSG